MCGFGLLILAREDPLSVDWSYLGARVFALPLLFQSSQGKRYFGFTARRGNLSWLKRHPSKDDAGDAAYDCHNQTPPAGNINLPTLFGNSVSDLLCGDIGLDGHWELFKVCGHRCLNGSGLDGHNADSVSRQSVAERLEISGEGSFAGCIRGVVFFAPLSRDRANANKSSVFGVKEAGGGFSQPGHGS